MHPNKEVSDSHYNPNPKMEVTEEHTPVVSSVALRNLRHHAAEAVNMGPNLVNLVSMAPYVISLIVLSQLTQGVDGRRRSRHHLGCQFCDIST